MPKVFSKATIDYVYIDATTLEVMVVAKPDNGDDVAVTPVSHTFTPQLLEDLADEVMEYVEEGGTLTENEPLSQHTSVSFVPEGSFSEPETKERQDALESLEDELLNKANRFCINGNCEE